MLLLCSYYVRTIQLRKGGVLMGAAPQQGREGAAPPPRCLISQRYSSLPSSSYTQIPNIERKERNTQTENTEGRKGKRKGKEISGKRKIAEKHLLKALILFCDKFSANLKNTPGKQENGSKMTRKRP